MITSSLPVKLATLPKGEYLRHKSPDSGSVWVKGDYDRSSKRFTCHRFDDVNVFRYLKSGQLVFSGFTF